MSAMRGRGKAMNAAETERRVRGLAEAAALPQEFDAWSGMLARLPQVRRRRTALRAATAAAAALAVGAAGAIPLSVGGPASAAGGAPLASSGPRTQAGVPAYQPA